MLGLGKVGKNVLLHYARENHRFKITWIADSRRVLTKRNNEPFDKKDVRKIVEIKDIASKAGDSPEYETRVSGSRVYEFDDFTNEMSIIREITCGTLRESIVIDTTSSRPQADYEVARNLIGCLAYCTGNKAPWADYQLCLRLYQKARRCSTFLGLNCTVGVWVDQMEILPILAQALRAGGVQFLKRDNSSFNLFFAKVGSGTPPNRAMLEIGSSGHLEKNDSYALPTEVKDQTLKARIAANICGIMRGQRPSKTQEATKFPLQAEPDSVNPIDIARWHKEGRKHGKYRALISEIDMDGRSIRWGVSFRELPHGHSLAKDFPGKCAFFVQPTHDARFNWSTDEGHFNSCPGSFTCSGFGGAARTASKLLWEAERTISLSQLSLDRECFPLPVLCSLAVGRSDATNLQRKLAKSLG